MNESSYNLQCFFKVLGLHVSNFKYGWSYPKEDHPHFELNYILDGYLKVVIDKTTYDLTKGDFLIIPPGKSHYSTAPNREGLSFLCFHFSIDDLLIRETLISQNKVFYSSSSKVASSLSRYFENLTLLFEDGIKPNSKLKFKFLLACLEILNILILDMSQTTTSIPNLNSPSTLKFAHLISEKIKHVFTPVYNKDEAHNIIATIIKDLSISNTYCNKVFHKVYSMSPRDYFILLKMREAKKLLLNAEFSIKQIADMLGYTSEGDFSKQYRKASLQSPLEYRKKGFPYLVCEQIYKKLNNKTDLMFSNINILCFFELAELRIISASNAKNWTYSNSSYFNIIYNIRGSFVANISNTNYNFEAGDVIFLNPYTNISLISKDDNSEALTFSFILDDVLLREALLFSNTFYYQKNSSIVNDLQFYLSRIYQVSNSISSSTNPIVISTQLLSALMGIVSVLSSCFLTVPKDLTPTATSLAHKIAYKLNKSFNPSNLNISNQSMLSSIAKDLNISTSYCTKLFKQVYNVSPNYFLITLKLQHAKDYLLNTTHSIDEISALMGYSCTDNFRKQFKRLTNMTPNEFRKHHAICDK